MLKTVNPGQGQASRMIRGVCAWLANRMDVDVSMVRLVAVLALLISPVTTLIIYFLATWWLNRCGESNR